MLFAKQEILCFLFKCVPTGHPRCCSLEGKARGIVGHSLMFLLQRTHGQNNCAIHFKEAPWGGRGGRLVGAKQENSEAEVFIPKPSIQSLLWHNGDRSSHRNKQDHRDTKGKEGKTNNLLSTWNTALYWLHIINHFYYLHIPRPCFCCRVTNTSNGTLVKWRLILEASTRWIVALTLLDFLPTMTNGSTNAHT